MTIHDAIAAIKEDAKQINYFMEIFDGNNEVHKKLNNILGELKTQLATRKKDKKMLD